MLQILKQFFDIQLLQSKQSPTQNSSMRQQASSFTPGLNYFLSTDQKTLKIDLSSFSIRAIKEEMETNRNYDLQILEIIIEDPEVKLLKQRRVSIDINEAFDIGEINAEAPCIIQRIDILRLVFLAQYTTDNFIDYLESLIITPRIEVYSTDLRAIRRIKRKYQKITCKWITFKAPVILCAAEVFPGEIVRQMVEIEQRSQKFQSKYEHLNYCSKVKEWQCYNLQYSQLRTQIKILNSIKEIQFTCLARLDFFKCAIQSVESLSRLRAPFLKIIRLNDNFITSVRPLVKLQSNKVREIHLWDNEFVELGCLPQMNEPKLEQMNMSIYARSGNHVESLRFVCRLMAHEKFGIKLSEIGRIQEKKIKEKIIQKQIKTIKKHIQID